LNKAPSSSRVLASASVCRNIPIKSKAGPASISHGEKATGLPKHAISQRIGQAAASRYERPRRLTSPRVGRRRRKSKGRSR